MDSMTTTEPTIDTLEAHQLRALRTANDSLGTITFHMRDGQGYIRAHRRAADTSSGFDEYVQINTCALVRNYDRDATQIHGDVRKFACFHSAYGRAFIGSLINRMRAGDTLTLAWTRDNNNQLNTEIGWHRDELHLQIHHATGRVEEYLVAVQVGPDNTARMVRIA